MKLRLILLSLAALLLLGGDHVPRHPPSHADSHSLAARDVVTATNLASACTDAQVLGGTAAGTGVECQADSGATAWDAIGNPATGENIAFADTNQRMTWDTPDTATSRDAFTFRFDHDATTDTDNPQRGVVIERRTTGGTETLEALLVIDNADTDGLVTDGILIVSADGNMTTAVNASDPEIVTALAIGPNDITTDNSIIRATDLDLLETTIGGQRTDEALCTYETTENELDCDNIILSDVDFGGGGIEIENNATLPGACTVGQIFMDTNETAGQQLFGCEGGTFVLQGDGDSGAAPALSAITAAVSTPTAIENAEFDQTWNWNMASDVAMDAFTFALNHDVAGTTNTQQVMVLRRDDSGGAHGDVEALLRLDNLDTDDEVDAAIVISAAGGLITHAISMDDAQISDVFLLDSAKSISQAEVGRLDGLAGIIATHATTVNDMDGTRLTVSGGVLNAAATLIHELGDAGGAGAVSLAELNQIWTWDTAAPAAAFTGITLEINNDATSGSTDQAVLAIERNATSGSQTMDDLLVIENLDTDGLVTNGINIIAAAGAMTNGINFTPTGVITTALNAADTDIVEWASIGVNTLNIGASGIPLASGDTATECVMLDAQAAIIDASVGPDRVTTDGTNFPYVTLDFDDTLAERVSWTFELPVNFDFAGTTLSVELVFIGNADCGGGASDDFCFELDGDSIAEGTNFDSALGGTDLLITETCPAGGNNDLIYTTAQTFTHGMGGSSPQRAVFLLTRNEASCSAAQDDLTGDLLVLGLRICYEVDNVFSGE